MDVSEASSAPGAGSIRFNRRKFLAHALWVAPAAAVADATVLEPSWLSVRTVHRPGGTGRHRFVHFSDVHFKGDPGPLETVVRRINDLSPDFACFTGDLVERAKDLPAAVERLRALQVPLYAVPGNHDLACKANLNLLDDVCRATGGAWLANRQVPVGGGELEVIGISQVPCKFAPRPGAFNLLLVHYPASSRRLEGRRCDLILAGHTHGGQVRLPFFGPLITPTNTDGYDLGLFESPGGPLYVNPGIGTLAQYEFRFNCRPELTVFTV